VCCVRKLSIGGPEAEEASTYIPERSMTLIQTPLKQQQHRKKVKIALIVVLFLHIVQTGSGGKAAGA
jgi:hypothetical protein